MTFGTPFGQGPVGGRTGTQTQTHIDEFELGPNGEVDILIAPASAMPDPRPRNSVVLEPGTAQLAIRETYFEKHPDRFARLRVELVPEPGEVVPHPILSTEELASKLEFAAMFLTFVGGTALQMWRDAEGNMNTFGGQAGSAHVAAQEDEVRSHSNAEMTYHGGRFRLEPGQALVVTVHEPDKPFLYWGLTLTSPWMESFDYRYATTALNNKTAQRSAGRVVADGHRAVPTPGWRTGSTPEGGSRATCSCAGCWPMARRTRRPRWSTCRTSSRRSAAGSEDAQLGRLGTSWTSQPLPSGSLKERNVS